MLYEDWIINGPYIRKSDGRYYIKLIHKITKKNSTVSYPKFLVEMQLGRYLEENETIDHIDRDVSNNDLSNLQVLSRKVHAALDAKRLKEVSFICEMCGKSFLLQGRKVRDALHNRAKGKTGPYCSRSCAGKVKKKDLYEIKKVNREYYLLDK